MSEGFSGRQAIGETHERERESYSKELVPGIMEAGQLAGWASRQEPML